MDKKKVILIGAITTGVLIIANAVIWGVVMLGSSSALEGTECYKEIQNLLVGGSFASMLFILTLGSIGGIMLTKMK
ncbi:MAG: hypothetical protein K8R54_02695 [Bacteroidales bacterium]|nr:hypothetical protein [Bacteroidales bacterium]